MENKIEFYWNGRLYRGAIFLQKNDMWWIMLDDGTRYLLATDEEGWFSPSLKRTLANLIGEQLNQIAEKSSQTESSGS